MLLASPCKKGEETRDDGDEERVDVEEHAMRNACDFEGTRAYDSESKHDGGYGDGGSDAMEDEDGCRSVGGGNSKGFECLE